MEVFVVVILHLSMFFIHNFFLTSFVTLPWTIARFLHPFCTFSPVHRRVIRDFIFRPFHDLLTASATVLSGHFLPTSVFYLMLLPNILAQPAFIKASLGAWELAVIPQNSQDFILILETQTRPICLFDSQ